MSLDVKVNMKHHSSSNFSICYFKSKNEFLYVQHFLNFATVESGNANEYEEEIELDMTRNNAQTLQRGR